jgi:hypothetical protein
MAFCHNPQPRLVCAEYSASQFVVEPTLLRISVPGYKEIPQFPDAYVYTLSVNRVLRGKFARNIRVYEGNDSGRAGFEWTPGEKYLLFLFYAPQEKS